MLEVRTPQGTRYVNPWQILYVEPGGEKKSVIYLPRRETRYYSMVVNEPADELAERVAVAMSGPFPRPPALTKSGRPMPVMRAPLVIKPPKPAEG